jgi:hypothetical protein
MTCFRDRDPRLFSYVLKFFDKEHEEAAAKLPRDAEQVLKLLASLVQKCKYGSSVGCSSFATRSRRGSCRKPPSMYSVYSLY